MAATDTAASERNLIWGAAAAVAVALPTLIAFNLPPSATFFNQAAALVGWGMLLVLIARELPARPPPAGSGLGALLAALALLAAAAVGSSWLTGLPWALSLSSAGMIAAAALAALVGSAARPAGLGAAAFRAFCVGLLVAGIATTLIGIVQVYAPQWADGNWIARSAIEGRAVGNLRQPNHVSSLLMWSLIAVVWLGEARVLSRAATWGAGLLLLFGVALSGSRTGWLGVGLLFVWGALDRRLSRRLRIALVLSPVAFVAMWFGIIEWAHYSQHVFGGEAQLHKADISSSRFGIWSNTVALIAAHPWFGVGWDEFNLAWSMTPFPGRPVAFFDHTHNLALQFAVELGLPLAGLVLGLIAWALWRAWADAHREDMSADALQTAMPRAAFAMVLMILIHSQLEYPLWYAYFLMPAAFAFGLCLGGQVREAPTATPVVVGASPRATRPLLVAAMLLTLGGVVSVYDYLRVVVIFAPEDHAAPLTQRIADGQRSLFFSYHGDYAAATTVEHPSQAMAAFDGATHYLLDARLMQAWATALDEVGDTQRARYVAQRLKEFRNEQADAFFEPCGHAVAAGVPPPFQCLAPDEPLDYKALMAPRAPLPGR